jgi:hypothetical protein
MQFSLLFLAEICDLDESNYINVTDRTSTMFTGLVTYNCSSINSSELFVFVNESPVDDCTVTEDFSYAMSDSTVNVTCQNIFDNAGRDWTFNLGRRFLRSQIIFNQTFTITLAPLSLNSSTNIDITVDENMTSALVFIPNCREISDPQYLVFRCNSSDLSNTDIPSNCTLRCFNLEPGSTYTTSLVRLPIRIADKKEDESNNTFPEEMLNQTYNTSNYTR